MNISLHSLQITSSMVESTDSFLDNGRLEVAFTIGYMMMLMAIFIYSSIRPLVCKLREPRYDAGLIVGHTIEAGAFTLHVTTYNCTRAVTRGPLITFPISASLIGLKACTKFLRILTMSLNKINMNGEIL